MDHLFDRPAGSVPDMGLLDTSHPKPGSPTAAEMIVAMRDHEGLPFGTIAFKLNRGQVKNPNSEGYWTAQEVIDVFNEETAKQGGGEGEPDNLPGGPAEAPLVNTPALSDEHKHPIEKAHMPRGACHWKMRADVRIGKWQRQAGDALCRPASKLAGPLNTPTSREVSCKKCIELADRYFGSDTPAPADASEPVGGADPLSPEPPAGSPSRTDQIETSPISPFVQSLVYPDAIPVCRSDDRQNWLQLRKLGIGSSDAPSVVGKGYRSPFQLWAEKRGLVEPRDLTDVEYVEAGKRLEPVVAEWYADRTGRTISGGGLLVRNKDYPFCQATCDRDIAPIDERGPGVLEIKTTGQFNAKGWEGEPPAYVQIQFQHQLFVTGLKWGSIACLIGGRKLVHFDMERSDRFIKWLLERELRFWEMVKNGTEPRANMPGDGEALSKLYGEDDGNTVNLPAEATEIDEQLRIWKLEKKAADAKVEALEIRLKQLIGSARFGLLEDGTQYEWKTVSRKGYTVETKTYRKLQRSKGGAK